MRTWGQTEGPNTEQFAIVKEKFAIHFFQFWMTANGFFWHGGLSDISMFTVDAKNTHPFTFMYRLQLFSKANSLTLGHVWSQWHYWKFSNASSSIFLILRIQVLVNSRGGIYKRCYFCLSQLPKIKKESTANTFVGQRGRGGHKEPAELTVLLSSVPPRCVMLWRSPEMIFTRLPRVAKLFCIGSPLNRSRGIRIL